ncbi:hypothetical protein GCM10012275_27330 [Longimycelium tulufanense]|uniref:Uncharacterized protein n=1 Tax=Longimycelium tulufanense TaxID=907463 RepID=A0A8J3CEQ7_9PSEU|nr:hypothetical protein [Longimycelium tulufanense]GGM54734.1 hypothetical protein GCM10012275_27330 [Longimycelium tulufanense]
MALLARAAKVAVVAFAAVAFPLAAATPAQADPEIIYYYPYGTYAVAVVDGVPVYYAPYLLLI